MTLTEFFEAYNDGVNMAIIIPTYEQIIKFKEVASPVSNYWHSFKDATIKRILREAETHNSVPGFDNSPGWCWESWYKENNYEMISLEEIEDFKFYVPVRYIVTAAGNIKTIEVNQV